MAGKWLKRITLIIPSILIGGILVGLLFIFGSGMLSLLWEQKAQSKLTACMVNLKSLSTALEMYAADHGRSFPPRDRWSESVLPYYKDRDHLICPAAGGNVPSYGMNGLIATKKLDEVKAPANVPAFFDSIPGASSSGGPELLPAPARHFGRNNIVFVDGHVHSIEDCTNTVWDPSALPPDVSTEARHADSK